MKVDYSSIFIGTEDKTYKLYNMHTNKSNSSESIVFTNLDEVFLMFREYIFFVNVGSKQCS